MNMASPSGFATFLLISRASRPPFQEGLHNFRLKFNLNMGLSVSECSWSGAQLHKMAGRAGVQGADLELRVQF